jgi:hypothetical protein
MPGSGCNPPATALILVAILPDRRDLEIARLLGWYRIPLRFAPKVVDVDYLAFYQTGSFGEEHRWRIENLAEVRGYELTTRADLFRDEPDHPRAREEYYKIQIGPLQSLSRPILTGRWKRLTFLYTTGEHLQHAHTINDLAVRQEDRAILWRSLRERALRNGQYQVQLLPEFPIDPLMMAMLGDLDKLAEGSTNYQVD